MAFDTEQPASPKPGAVLPSRPSGIPTLKRRVLLNDAWPRLRIEVEIPNDAGNARLITANFYMTGTVVEGDDPASGGWLDISIASARGLEIPSLFAEDLHPKMIHDSVFCTCDEVNDNLMEAATALSCHGADANALADNEYSDGVLVMDFARVEAPFRGQGLGYLLLDAVRSATMGVNIVAIHPSPILTNDQITGDPEAKKKLAEFWSRAPHSGFDLLGDGVETPLLCLGVWTPKLFDIEALRQTKIPEALIHPE